MVNDQFGIKKIFPTRVGGREWYLAGTSGDIMKDPLSDGDLKDDIASGGNTTDGFLVKDNSQVRLKVAADSSLVDYSDPNLDQSAAKGRGFMKDVKEWDINGLECTARIKCTDHDTDDSRFIIKGPTGSHRSNTDDCSGSSYMSRWFLADTGSDAATTENSKEQWHVHYVNRENQKDTGMGHIFNKWVICKYVISKEKRKDDNNVQFEAVRIRTYLCSNNDGVTFKLVNETVDIGGWGDAAKDCGADKDDEIMTWRAYSIIFRWDGPIIRWKDLSIREVDTLGLTDPGEPQPTDGSISKDYTFSYNMGAFQVGTCGVAEDTTVFRTIYDVSDNGSSSNLHQERYRVGEIANGSLSDLVGKTPRRVTVLLSKTGSPPSGPITCVLRKAQTDEVAVTFGYTGGTLNATDLTTTKTAYIFQNLTSTYVWQAGDILTVEYSGNTTDNVNDINVFRNTEDPFDGSQTCARKFDNGGPPPEGYTTLDLTRDYAWKIEETV